MNSRTACVAIFTAVISSAGAGTISSVYFPSSVTPPPVSIPASLKGNEGIFRAGLLLLPESVLVVGALAVGGIELGLSQEESRSLTPLATDAYASMAKDSTFADLPSALPYCFASSKQTNGHYFLHQPANMSDTPHCIVFLHGYGGNFQFYIWVLKDRFPHAVILAPSWGMSWASGNGAYIQSVLQDAERRLNVPLRRPWLIGLSAGGYGGFAIYSSNPSNYEGYVSLAAAPPENTLGRMSSDMRMLMMAGTRDNMLPISKARRWAAAIKRRVPQFSYREVEADHFFFLSARTNVCTMIREFMKE